MLLTAALSETVSLAVRGPTLPGYAEAVQVAEQHGLRLSMAAEVSAIRVAIPEAQLTVTLATAALATGPGAEGGERAGKSFTRAGKAAVKAENAASNGGKAACAQCGEPTVPPQQHQSGVTPPRNEAHVDHVVPKSKGGNGSPDNGQVLCRGCNLEKGAR